MHRFEYATTVPANKLYEVSINTGDKIMKTVKAPIYTGEMFSGTCL